MGKQEALILHSGGPENAGPGCGQPLPPAQPQRSQAPRSIIRLNTSASRPGQPNAPTLSGPLCSRHTGLLAVP